MGGTVGNPYLMKAMNRAAVTDALAKHGPVSQTQICEMTGLSRATVSNIMKELQGEELVYEAARAESKGGGRRQVLMQLNAKAGYVIGVDLGGTKMAGAVTDLGGNQVLKARRPTRAEEGPDAVLDGLIAFIREMVAESGIDASKIRGVGVGVPGVVRSGGLVEWAPALQWRNLRLSRLLGEALPYPVFVENDVNLLALGEYWYGAGQGCESMVCLAVGTGLGAGIIVGGQLLTGAHRAAGEVCNLIVDHTCLGRGFQSFGCLEAYASGPGLVSIFDKTTGREMGLDAETVFDMARSGDATAARAVEEFTRHLGIALVALATVIDPEAVVLGGGVSQSADLFRDRLVELCKPVLQVMPDVRVSTLGVDAGVMGAVALTLHNTNENPFRQGEMVQR